jgi:hypothetical protein
MTRLKIGMDKNATSQGVQTTVVATITMTYAGGPKIVKASQNVTITNEDCAASDIAVMRLSIQPPTVSPNASAMVRAIVPPVATVKQPAATTANQPGASATSTPATAASATPERKIPTHDLTKILCTKDSDTKSENPFLIANSVSDRYLSPEVFVGFSIFVAETQQIRMEWSYDPHKSDSDKAPAATPPAAPAPYTLKASGLVVVGANVTG